MRKQRSARTETCCLLAAAMVCAATGAAAATGSGLSTADIEAAWPGVSVMTVRAVREAPSESAWNAVEAVTLGYLDSKLTGKPERNQTLVRVVCDAGNLYVRFECHEEEIKALVTNSASLWQDDECDLLLDVGRTEDVFSGAYFIIEANPAGRFATNRGDGRDWRPAGAVVRSRISNDCWTVEMRVSFADLGLATNAVPAVWGANFCRFRAIGRGDVEHAAAATEFAWTSTPLAVPHLPSRFGALRLESGNRMPVSLAAALARAGKDPKAFGLLPVPAQPEPALSQEAPPRKVAAWAAKPAVAVSQDKAMIRFATTDPADAAVWVQDDKQRTVRHLAAGLLGTNAPAPFLPGALIQELPWNFRDDYGKPVPPGKYSLHVGLGLRATWDKILVGGEPRVDDIRGLSVDKDGRIHMLTNQRSGGHYKVTRILTFDREGKYVREMYPMPGNQPASQVAGAAVVPLPGGDWIPAVHQGMLHSLMPLMGEPVVQRAAMSADGRLIIANGVSEIYMGMPKRLLLLGTDGSVAPDYAGPVLAREPVGGMAAIAVSPDGRQAYVTGLAGESMYGGKLHQVVYRLALDAGAPPLTGDFAAPFIGEFMKAGSDATHLDDPRGLAIDAGGNIYVADSRNNRIAVFGPDGKLLRAVGVPRPLQVEVDAGRGRMYVLSETNKVRRIVKFAPLDAPREVCAVETPAGPKAPALLCLDAGAEPPALWLPRSATALCCFRDEGDALRKDDRAIGGDEPRPWSPVWHGTPIRWFELGNDDTVIHVPGNAYDAVSGTRLQPRPACYLRGLDGRYYTFEDHIIRRFEQDKTPAPFAKTGEIRAPTAYYFCVDATGNVYTAEAAYEAPETRIVRHGPDGAAQAEAFVTMPTPAMSSGPAATLAADWDGGLFIAGSLKEPDHAVPDLFTGRLQPGTGVTPNARLFYEHFYGSVVKFGPGGGKATLDPAGDLATGRNYGGLSRCRVTGVQWTHLGISPLVYRNRDHARCTCEHASFGADGFRRLFLPDAYRYSVEIIDRNGNSLLRFGRYGNVDDRPRNAGVGFDIPMAWPIRVRAGDDACFVADMLNDRLLRVKLSYAAEEAVPVEVR